MPINRVHIVGELHESAVKEFEQSGYVITRSKNLDEKQLLKLAYDAQVIVLTDMAFKNEWFSSFPHLKLIARRGVGYDNVSIEVATQHGVWVTNTPGANAISVAELTITLILNTLRHIKRSIVDNYFSINSSQIIGHNLHGKTVGIVGYGQIAQHVESMLNGFGVNILVYSHHKVTPNYGQFVDFQTLLAHSDVITLHIPATQETHNIFNHETFSKMKQGAILVNTSRGSLVDEQALIDAIKSHKILGAGLDTIRSESLSLDSPVQQQKQIMITPHLGANTIEAEYITAMSVVSSITSFFKGFQPNYTINQIELAN